MISLIPGTNTEHALDLVNRAALATTGLDSGVGIDVFTAYNAWATTHLRTLSSVLTPAEVQRLITTPRYWALLQVNPSAYGSNLANLVRLEIADRQSVLMAAKAELEDDLRRYKPGTVIALLDSNVLMRHGHELQKFDWHGTLGERSNLPLVLFVPIVVVEELDRLKRDRAEMVFGTRRVLRRNLARTALATLNQMFDDPKSEFLFEQEGVPRRRLRVQLLLDEPGHVRADRVDAEVIDRGVSLLPYVDRVHVVTYDASMTFQARSMGLKAVQLPEPEEQPPKNAGTAS